jgi:trans-aconitate methyltransferase
MTEPGIQQESNTETNETQQGTATPEQPQQSQDGQTNQEQEYNPVAGQADYTRKTQELADQKQQLEAERVAFQQQQQHFQQQQQHYQGVGYTQQPQADPLVDQFGSDGAQAIRGLMDEEKRQIYQQQYSQQYAQEYQAGLKEHGDEWKKFDFIDPQTGATRNKILDVRSTSGLTSEQAWRAYNPVDTKKIEQNVRDQTYQEIEKKADATPSSSNVQGQGSAPAELTTVRDAYAAALKQHGVG